MRKSRKNTKRIFCHVHRLSKEEKTQLFLNQAELESEVAKKCLLKSIRKAKSRIWNFENRLLPRVIGAESVSAQ